MQFGQGRNGMREYAAGAQVGAQIDAAMSRNVGPEFTAVGGLPRNSPQSAEIVESLGLTVPRSSVSDVCSHFV